MISSDNRRYAYGKSQLIEVICQLRFPTILSIDTREPADFQETVRAAFPRYQCQVEKLPGVNGAPARTVNNHTFISEDGGYKLSLTKDFIALSTMRYTHWEDFAARLDEPLGQFIKIYRPNCFDRVGLRFVNAISREQLGLTGRRWNDLLQPPYLGILDEDGVDEASVAKCSVDAQARHARGAQAARGPRLCPAQHPQRQPGPAGAGKGSALHLRSGCVLHRQSEGRRRGGDAQRPARALRQRLFRRDHHRAPRRDGAGISVKAM